MKRTILIILLLMTALAQGQSFLPLNSSNYNTYQIGFYNPAALALVGNLRATAGMQFLHTGLAEAALRNHYLGVILPVAGEKTALGLQTQYFSADIFQKMALSLQASRRLYRDRLSIGLNVNMLHHGYNQEKFVLFDMHDPVIADGTTSTVFSMGAGLYMEPIKNLHVGIALDHFNEPDISLDKTGIRQKKIVYAGVSYSHLPLIPQADVRLEGEEMVMQFGVHMPLLDQKLRLFAGYNQFAGAGSNVLAEAELRFKNLGLVYALHYPLTSGMSSLSSGSHQIGVVFSGGGEQASVPVVQLDNLSSRLQIPQAWLRGKATNQDGLKTIEIRINDRLWKTMPPSVIKGAKTFDISETIPLDQGRNIVQVTAIGRGMAGSDKTFTLFEPAAPKIEILSPKNIQTNAQDYTLHFAVQDVNELKKVRVFRGSELLSEMNRFQLLVSMDTTRTVRLTDGKNILRIEAENAWGSSIDSLWIEYRSKEIPPTLSISSKDQPISATSQIVLNLNLENADNIKEVIVKVNGTVVDTARVRREKGFAIHKVAGYDSTVVVDLASQNKNLIEAIAVDDDGLPRVSQSLSVYYNPYAEKMRYSKRKAYIIGINNYKNSEVPDLVDAIPDARSMAAVLDSVYHFDLVKLYLDAQADYAALNALFSDSLARAKPGEMVVIYFSGHGDKLMNNESDPLGFLMPWDADLDSYTKRITMEFIKGFLKNTPAADVLCIFDACFSGAAIVTRPNLTFEQLPSDVNYDILYRNSNKKAVNLITAASRHEPAVDGLFTRYLVRGLRGAADRNDDGYITDLELALYASKYVADEARNRYMREQNPQVGGLFSEFGECVFERR